MDYGPCVFRRDERGEIVTETITGKTKGISSGLSEIRYIRKQPNGEYTSEIILPKASWQEADFKLYGARCSVCGHYVLVDSLPDSARHTPAPPTPPPLTVLSTPAPTTVPPHEHSWAAAPGVPSTCTRAGWTGYRYCAVCGIAEGRQSLPLAEHTWEDVPEREASCFVAGYTAHKRCAVCGATEGKEELPKAHKWSEEWYSSGTLTSFQEHYKPCVYCGKESEHGRCVFKLDSNGDPVIKEVEVGLEDFWSQRRIEKYGVCAVCGHTMPLPEEKYGPH